MWANVGFSRHVTTAQPCPRNSWQISLKGVRPHSETKFPGKDGLQSGYPHLGLPAWKPHSCTDSYDLLWCSWWLSAPHAFPSFDTLKKKCSWKGENTHNDKEAMMQTSLIWDNRESQQGWFWWGTQDNPWGPNVLQEVAALIALHSHDASPCLGHGSVCAHLWWSWWDQSRLSSALMLPIAHLSRDKHLSLTFTVQLHCGTKCC